MKLIIELSREDANDLQKLYESMRDAGAAYIECHQCFATVADEFPDEMNAALPVLSRIDDAIRKLQKDGAK